MKLDQLINSTLITEKTTALSEKNNSLTVIASSCRVTKAQVKSLINSIFPKLEVKKIRSMNLHPKVKVFRGREGVRVKRKKMIISFFSNDAIKLISG